MTCKDCIHFEQCSDVWGEYTKNAENNCGNFKDKSKFISLEEKPFTHICKNDYDLYPTTFTIYARVIDATEETVTIDRFQKFGAVHCGTITISREDFEKYYKLLDLSGEE